jgi:ribosome-binding ATPase YchF (GTP1/OBG family)
MHTVTKQRNSLAENKEIKITNNNKRDKKTTYRKSSKLVMISKNVFAVINMQEDEDAAVRPDVWN